MTKSHYDINSNIEQELCAITNAQGINLAIWVHLVEQGCDIIDIKKLVENVETAKKNIEIFKAKKYYAQLKTASDKAKETYLQVVKIIMSMKDEIKLLERYAKSHEHQTELAD